MEHEERTGMLNEVLVEENTKRTGRSMDDATKCQIYDRGYKILHKYMKATIEEYAGV